MDIATSLVRALVNGAVVCRESNSRGFAYLSDAEGLNITLDKLAPLGLKIVMTSTHAGFFAAEDDHDEAGRHLRASAERLAQEAQRIEDFQSFLLDVFPEGQPIRCGSEISASELLDAVNASSALVESLTQLTSGLNMTSNTTAKRVSNLLGNLARDGYLICVNARTEQYRATAKIDRAWDVTENFASKRPGAMEAIEAAMREDAGQGDLFS